METISDSASIQNKPFIWGAMVFSVFQGLGEGLLWYQACNLNFCVCVCQEWNPGLHTG
jgi:hypothetical protein